MFYTKNAACRKVSVINFTIACGVSMASVNARAELFYGQELSLGAAKTIEFAEGNSANAWNFAAKTMSKLETPFLVIEAAKNIENGGHPPSELAYLAGAYYGGKVATYALSPVVKKACSGSTSNKVGLAGCIATAAAAAYSIATIAERTGKAAKQQWGSLEQTTLKAIESQTSSETDRKERANPIVGLAGIKKEDASYLNNLEIPPRTILDSKENYAEDLELDNKFNSSSEENGKRKNLSYELDKDSGNYVWKVDGKIVDSSNEEVQRFCADPSKNCPVQGTGAESTQPVADKDGATPTIEADTELASPTTNPVEELPSQQAVSADSDTIGGMQSRGGNPVVEPGNSIWHGEGGFQGEEYDDKGLNGTSNIKQFKLWDSDELAPQTNSEVQKKTVTAERVIDEPVPRGSVDMPDEKYMADPNSEYGNSSSDTSSFAPTKDSSEKNRNVRQSNKNRNINRNQGYRPRSSGCGGIDYSTPFPKSCF